MLKLEKDKRNFSDFGYLRINNFLSSDEINQCLKEGDFLEKKCIDEDIQSKDFSFEKQEEKILRAIFNVKDYSSYISNLMDKKDLINNVLKKVTDYNKYEIVGSIFWFKKAKVASSQPWHQDLAYHQDFRDRYDFGANLWIALDTAKIENGCLQILPGSHKSNLVVHETENNGLREILEIDIKKVFPKIPILPMELNPGDAILFNWLCAHCSEPNFSSNSRRALSFGFLMKDG